jgi:hypothetical protein
MKQKQYLPGPKTRARYGISEQTKTRWVRDPKLGFPQPLRINNHEYFDVEELDAFDARMREVEAPPDIKERPANLLAEGNGPVKASAGNQSNSLDSEPAAAAQASSDGGAGA